MYDKMETLRKKANCLPNGEVLSMIGTFDLAELQLQDLTDI